MKMNINGEVRELTEEEIKEFGLMDNDPQTEIETLKTELATYDYIGVKIAMGVATKEEYAEQIAYTESLREKIRELESNNTH